MVLVPDSARITAADMTAVVIDLAAARRERQQLARDDAMGEAFRHACDVAEFWWRSYTLPLWWIHRERG
jgi:hypothetical protein